VRPPRKHADPLWFRGLMKNFNVRLGPMVSVTPARNRTFATVGRNTRRRVMERRRRIEEERTEEGREGDTADRQRRAGARTYGRSIREGPHTRGVRRMSRTA